MDDRAEFVKQWFNRSQSSMDDFERYVFLYLCLVVIAKTFVGKSGDDPANGEGLDDGLFIDKYFGHHDNAKDIVGIAESVASLSTLVNQKNDNGDHIVFCNTAKEQQKLKALYMHYRSGTVLTLPNKASAIGTLLKAIRNNLFHGRKYYEKQRDRTLLENAAPLLEALVIDGATRQLGLAFAK